MSSNISQHVGLLTRYVNLTVVNLRSDVFIVDISFHKQSSPNSLLSSSILYFDLSSLLRIH